MKKKLKKIIIVLSIMLLVICNSVSVFASNINNVTSMEIGYRENYVCRAMFDVCGTFRNIALVGDNDGIYRIYIYADDNIQLFEESLYFSGVYRIYRLNYQTNALEYYGEKSSLEIRSSSINTVTGISVFHSIDSFKNTVGYKEPSTEEPPTEEPSTEEPPTEEPSTEEPPTEEPPTEEPPTEEPPTEVPPTEEPPTEVPPTEEPPTEVPPTEEPPTENIDYGIAGNLVSDLIGNCKEFTPQSVMAIFVICLILECLSHIASAILSVGGMK